MPYKVPGKVERKAALTGKSECTLTEYGKTYTYGTRKFFQLSYEDGTNPFFKEIQNCDPSDWLLNHKEGGQTFEDFKSQQSSSGTDLVCGDVAIGVKLRRRSVFILPLGTFLESKGRTGAYSNSLLQWLESYCAAFFCTAKVVMLQPVSIEEVACNYRVNDFTGRYQLDATDILRYLKQRKTKKQDCLIAVTMLDLYPKPSWNFVFGLASTSKSSIGGVGVFSFCRYDDEFYETWRMNEDTVKRTKDGNLDYSVFNYLPNSILSVCDDVDGKLLLRACKVMTHEVCHMFGLKHCIWMQCLMNGSNHLGESDRRPSSLCPVCLRKLQSVLNFDVLERYKILHEWTSGSLYVVKSKKIRWLSDYERRITLVDHSKSKRKSRLEKRFSPDELIEKYHKGTQKQSKKKITGNSPNGIHAIEMPPLEKFSDFRDWLRDAIEYIRTDGKPGIVPSRSTLDLSRSIYF